MRLNAADPNWIPPLISAQVDAFTPKNNPFFEHAEVQFWLASRDGRDVGRISAQIDSLAPTGWTAASLNTTVGLAAFSRELSCNDWQRDPETAAQDGKRGAISDRNVELLVKKPF